MHKGAKAGWPPLPCIPLTFTCSAWVCACTLQQQAGLLCSPASLSPSHTPCRSLHPSLLYMLCMGPCAHTAVAGQALLTMKDMGRHPLPWLPSTFSISAQVPCSLSLICTHPAMADRHNEARTDYVGSET